MNGKGNGSGNWQSFVTFNSLLIFFFLGNGQLLLKRKNLECIKLAQ
jgi:hypothetical protein